MTLAYQALSIVCDHLQIGINNLEGKIFCPICKIESYDYLKQLAETRAWYLATHHLVSVVLKRYQTLDEVIENTRHVYFSLTSTLRTEEYQQFFVNYLGEYTFYFDSGSKLFSVSSRGEFYKDSDSSTIYLDTNKIDVRLGLKTFLKFV